MTVSPHFDQKNQSVDAQTNIGHADQVIIQSSNSASALSVPHQIPPLPPDFTGRDDEIKSLLGKFDQGATIAGLRGMGGEGKTALALAISSKLTGRYPDGQLFVNMLGMSKSPLKPEDAMAYIIRSYRGADAPLPLDFNGLSGLYHSVLSGKKTLLLLDNAASREQVEPLLPPPGSALLVTSRIKFAIPGLLEEMDLDPGVLPQEDAKKLILKICERIGDHAEELAKLCGCLPIALQNAAYVLKEKPNLSLEGYIERLGIAKKRLELVDASFSTSFELLTPELQRLWCLLSVFPADFDLHGAAAVWEMERIPAEDALGELVKWSLVEFLHSVTGEAGRYRLHDLARDFGSSCLGADAGELAQQRHSTHYQEVLWRANSQFLKWGDSYSEGLILFNAEWINIEAGQKWAAINSEKSNEIAAICSNYSGAWDLLDLLLHPRKHVKWLEDALFAARKIQNRKIEAAHLCRLGAVYSELGDSNKAIAYCKQALDISREIGDLRIVGGSLVNLGIAYYFLGDPFKAIEYYGQALIIAREIGDLNGEGFILGNLGLVYSHLGDFSKSIEYHEKDLDVARKIGNQRGEGTSLGNLGVVCSQMGDYLKSIQYFKQGLDISRKICDRRLEENQLGNLGNAYYRLDKPRQAIEYYEQALHIARQICDKRGEGNSLGNLGNVYSDLGNQRLAIEHYDQALVIAREIGDRSSEANNLFNTSRSLYELGEQGKAISMAKLALAIYEQIDSPYIEAVWKVLSLWETLTEIS